MDQEKTGKFIARRRKEAGLTQAALGERLGVTDRAVSKWERGICLPDAALMLPLCQLLGITVNELLTGEEVIMENYKAKAEQNLLELRRQEENNRVLLRLETVIGCLGTAAGVALILAGCLAAEALPWRIGLIAAGAAIVAVAIGFALCIEHDAGYYQCPHCGKAYVPTKERWLWPRTWAAAGKCAAPTAGRRATTKKSSPGKRKGRAFGLSLLL